MESQHETTRGAIEPEIQVYFRLAGRMSCDIVSGNAAALTDLEEDASMRRIQAAVAEMARGRKEQSSSMAFPYARAIRTFQQAAKSSAIECGKVARINKNIVVARRKGRRKRFIVQQQRKSGGETRLPDKFRNMVRNCRER